VNTQEESTDRLSLFERFLRASGIRWVTPKAPDPNSIDELSQRDADFLKELMELVETAGFIGFRIYHSPTVKDRRDLIEVTLYAKNNQTAIRVHRLIDYKVEWFLHCVEAHLTACHYPVEWYDTDHLGVGHPDAALRPTLPSVEPNFEDEFNGNLHRLAQNA
jgi:hypothetical protein